jgi:hypothetical protein
MSMNYQRILSQLTTRLRRRRRRVSGMVSCVTGTGIKTGNEDVIKTAKIATRTKVEIRTRSEKEIKSFGGRKITLQSLRA